MKRRQPTGVTYNLYENSAVKGQVRSTPTGAEAAASTAVAFKQALQSTQLLVESTSGLSSDAQNNVVGRQNGLGIRRQNAETSAATFLGAIFGHNLHCLTCLGGS